MNAPKRLPYRPEIDGLRALAIIPVVLFHAGVSGFSGGFVGVDIFFVISGFLITSIIARKMEEGRFSYRDFYERRIRRLVPPLLPVLVVSILIAFFALDIRAYREFSWSVLTALTATSNWYFLSLEGYFGTNAFTKPLLNLWSLAIEEQFYLVFPAMLALGLAWGRRILVGFVITMLAASLGYAVWLVEQGLADAAFYNSAARFWELLFGAGLALMGTEARHRTVAIVARTVAVAMMVWSITVYTHKTEFPGLSALLPVAGATLFIWAGPAHHGPIYRVFSWTPVVAIGQVSYAWYLWHWPMIVLLPVAFPGLTDIPYHMLGIAAGTLGLSFLSKWVLEDTVRTKRVLRRSGTVFAFFGISLASTIALATPGVYQPLIVKRAVLLNGSAAGHVLSIAAERDYFMNITARLNWNGKVSTAYLRKYKRVTCSFDRANPALRIKSCIFSQFKDSNILVIGDSIGRDTARALSRAYPDKNILNINHSGCPPAQHTPDHVKPYVDPDDIVCFGGMNAVIEDLAEYSDIHAILLSYRYQPKRWAAIADSIPFYRENATWVAMIGVTPVFRQGLDTYMKDFRDSAAIPDRIGPDNPSMYLYSTVSLTEGAARLAIKQGIPYVNVTDDLCPDGACRLWKTDGTPTPLYIDDQHFSRYGIEVLADIYRTDPILQKIMGGAESVLDPDEREPVETHWDPMPVPDIPFEAPSASP